METGLRAPAVKKQTQRARVARQARANPWSYIYLAPMVVLVASFIIYPSFASLGYTFYDWSGIGEPSQYVGLDNFQRVMTDGLFWHAFLHTFIYAGVLVPVQLTLALILALVLNNRRLRGATVYRAIYFIPVVMAPAIIGVVVQLLLTNFGEDLNRLLIPNPCGDAVKSGQTGGTRDGTTRTTVRGGMAGRGYRGGVAHGVPRGA